MSQIKDIRDAVHDAINTKKLAAGYTTNDFDLNAVWFPNNELINISNDGVVWVVGMNYDDTTPGNRSQNLVRREFPVQIAIQKKINPADDTTIETFLDLAEELRDTCRKEVSLAGFQWTRNDASDDQQESKTPYVYEQLQGANLLHIPFFAIYLSIST